MSTIMMPCARPITEIQHAALSAAMASGVPFAITHAPGHMFITDVPDVHYEG